MPNQAELRPTIGVIASRYPPAGVDNVLSGIGEQYLLAVEAGGGIPLSRTGLHFFPTVFLAAAPVADWVGVLVTEGVPLGRGNGTAGLTADAPKTP